MPRRTPSLGNGRAGSPQHVAVQVGQASCRTRQAGEQHGQAAQMALPGSGCTPELHSWFVLCLLQDEKPFQKGFVASTPACYHVLWTYLSKAMLNWTSMHFVLFCSIDVPPSLQASRLFYKTQKIYLSFCVSIRGISP